MAYLENIPNLTLAYTTFLFASTILGAIFTFYDKKQFLRCFAFLSTIQCIITFVKPVLLFPKYIQLDGLHTFMGIASGLNFLVFAVLAWTANTSSDSTPRTSFMAAWIVGTIFKMLMRGYLIHKTGLNSSELSQQGFCHATMFIIDAAWILLMLYHLYKYSSWGGYAASTSWINVHLRIDQFVIFLAALVVMGFPHQVVREISTLDRLDNYHVFVGQIHGANYLTLAIIAWRALHYINNRDKAIYFLCRVLFTVAACLYVLYAYYTYPMLRTTKLIQHGGVAVVVGINAFLGFASWKWPNMLKFK